MTHATNFFAVVFAANVLAGAASAQEAQPVQPANTETTAPVLTPELINTASLDRLLAEPEPVALAISDADLLTGSIAAAEPEKRPDPAMARLQVLLDRAGASPGVVDGFDGENVRKAIAAFETMRGLAVDGMLDPDVIAAINSDKPVVGSYVILAQDVAAIVDPLPSDYAELAKRSSLGYQSASELLAERFHMDEKFLLALNPGASFSVGSPVFVTAYGPDLRGTVAHIEADKGQRQVRAYDAEGRLIAAYPATIGSPDNPSPSGSHRVEGVAMNPTYTYNPEINFQQGHNTEVLTLPPGPNGPVGSVWIDLSEPTFGIHGTPEPSLIDKTGSHGCVRLTNWDARELAAMVSPGVMVDFID